VNAADLSPGDLVEFCRGADARTKAEIGWVSGDAIRVGNRDADAPVTGAHP